jgi:tetratricopeptide (TPR) repeat protein
VDLSLEIAQTLHMACQPHAAAAALDRALAAAPAHHLPRLHAAKASLLRELGATQEALACIERALQTCPSDPLLHAAAAELMRQQHNLPAALQHALTAQNFALGDPLSTAEDLAALAELAASLAVSLLDFDQARQILISAAHSTPSMHLLLAELALEADEEVHAAEALTAAIETLPAPQESGDRQTFVTPNHLRTLALQARLAYRRGDPEMAQRMFQDALQIHREQEASSLITTQPPRFAEYPFWAAHALGNAAIDIGDWAAALWLAQRAFDLDTHQPLAQYQLAAALIHRAEAQRLCLAAEVVAHAPGEIALSEEALQCFSESIHAAAREASLAVSAGQPAETAPTPPAVRLQRLLARGLAAFDTRQNPTQLPVRTPAAIEHFWEARRAYEKGSLAQAQRSLEVALALWPNEARWHRLAADISAQAQQEAEYLAHLELAVELEPLHAGHRMALGHALLSLADGLPGALRAFEQACDLAPDELNPWMALAETQFKAGQLEAAAISAERAVNTAPDQLEPLLLRAQIALESHQPADAQEYAQAALSIYPADPTALLITSQALQALNRPEEGLEMIEHALPWGADCKDLSLPLQVQRIDLLRLTKGVETALPPASMLASSHPQSPAVLAVLAQTLADAGEHSQAVYTAQKALQQEKTQPEETGLRPAQKANLHYLLGSLLRRSGQLDQAIHHLQHCLEFAPRWLEPYLALGQAQQERRQYRKALASYQRAIAISPFDARPYLQAGLALKDGKDYREAEAMLRQAAELAPKDVSIRRQLAAVVALNLVHNPSRVGQTNSIEV